MLKYFCQKSGLLFLIPIIFVAVLFYRIQSKSIKNEVFKSPNISSTSLMKNIKDVVNKVIESPKAEKPKIIPEEVSSSTKKINSRTGNLTKDLIEVRKDVFRGKEAILNILPSVKV